VGPKRAGRRYHSSCETATPLAVTTTGRYCVSRPLGPGLGGLSWFLLELYHGLDQDRWKGVAALEQDAGKLQTVFEVSNGLAPRQLLSEFRTLPATFRRKTAPQDTYPSTCRHGTQTAWSGKGRPRPFLSCTASQAPESHGTESAPYVPATIFASSFSASI